MVRILTYNVHHCRGTDGKISPERIAEVIAPLAVDIVALQEVDVHRARSGTRDQAQVIADQLGMNALFHHAFEIGGERYGNAILTAHSAKLVRAAALPGVQWLPRLEPRSALWAAISIKGTEIQIFNTHLGLTPVERQLQIAALLGRGWLKDPRDSGPQIFVGDLNAGPGSFVCRRLAANFQDARQISKFHANLATFPSAWPRLRIDHIFFSGSLKVTSLETINTRQTRVASDHLPLLANFHLH